MKESEAVWAARLFVEGKVITLSDESMLAICRELVEAQRTVIVRATCECGRAPKIFTDGIKVTP